MQAVMPGIFPEAWARRGGAAQGPTACPCLRPPPPQGVSLLPGRPGGREAQGWEGRSPGHPPLQPCISACPPAAPRSCVIDKDELKDGLRVLIPMDDKLLYAGHVQTVHSPDM